ncbi:acyl-CoA synthetase, partial [Magnaporthiopsis poae ATCC 64411]
MDTLLPYPTTDFIKHWATEHPDRTACCDTGLTETWTYAELEGDVSAAAAHLAEQGVQAGDRVAVLARNSVYLVILQHALMRLGAIFVPLNWRLSRPELAKLIADCSPTIIYTDRTHQGGSSTAMSTTTDSGSATAPSATETAAPPSDGCRRLELQVFIDALQDARESPPSSVAPRNVSDNAVATILYTSGTSGKPKGVVMTRSTMSCTAANFSGLGSLDQSSKLLCDAPMFHVIGLVVAVWAPLSSCAVFVVSPRFDPAETNDRLADGITHYFCVP